MFKRKSYLGSNLPSTLFQRVKKQAHDVWDMSIEGERVLAVRKKQDTAKVSKEEVRDLQKEFVDGDIVFINVL